jgi:hypothetical protein
MFMDSNLMFPMNSLVFSDILYILFRWGLWFFPMCLLVFPIFAPGVYSLSA